jgi:uncharacterized repeat protein (TIGR03803 family)
VNLKYLRSYLGAALLVLASLFQSPAQVFEDLYSFTNSPDGASPKSAVILGSNTLYGTTFFGGTNGVGTLFSLGIDGKNYTVLHTFGNADDGSYPYAGLLLVSNTLYGATFFGGDSGDGIVFSLGIDGQNYKVLHTFTNSPDGAAPYGALVLGSNKLYGTTYLGGDDVSGGGTIYSMDLSGNNYSVLYSFTNSPDGTSPCQPEDALLFSGNTLYGTASYGGTNQGGVVFSIGANGENFTTLHAFNGSTDGYQPLAGLILTENILYGTTFQGGTNQAGTIFSFNLTNNDFRVVYSFEGLSDGGSPNGGVAISKNTLYGTVSGGGDNGAGTVFSINTDGSDFNVIHTFDPNNPADGSQPEASPTLSGNVLYSTTYSGGMTGNGTVFHVYLKIPTLNIIPPSGTNSLSVFWPSTFTGFVLQKNNNLRTTNWIPVTQPVNDDGTNKSVTLPGPLTGALFLRLSAP